MRESKTQPARPELKALVAEAAKSLAKLDADRLEELALSCEALHCEGSGDEQQLTLREVRGAKRDMALLAKVLEATRTNVAVMSRLRELRTSRMEYSVGQEPKNATEDSHGLN
jgi:alpha-D-ribose 1-methylphosphonate 5-triphosphate synthase subunit PhnI